MKSPARASHEFEIRSKAVAGARLSLYVDLDSVEALWRDLEARANRSVFQSYDYLQTWFRHIGEKEGWRPAIVVARSAEDVLAILPFAVSGGGVLRRLTWLGQELCDYLGPIYSAEFAAIPAAQFRTLWREVGALLRSNRNSRHDYVELRRMPAQIDGHANPLVALSTIRHASDGHVARLGGNWSEFYRARRSGRARKQDRSKLQRLAEFGEVRLFTPTNSGEIARVLDTLFAQRSENFARKGIRDVFQRPGYRDFFIELATTPRSSGRLHVSALQVGPSLAATSLAIEHGRSYSLLLIGYDKSLAQFSPGALHLNLLIDHAIEHGLQEFDFLVGEQRLKREWADFDVPLYDYISAAGWRGLLVAPVLRGFARLKRTIKQNPLLWTAYMRLRAACGARRG